MKIHALAAAAMAAFISLAPAIPSAHAETTLCTEITALPFTITVQGVYCLKQNLNVNLASGNAITINAGNVIVEFNGFRINSQAPTTNSARGVYALDRKNITLRNGFIRGFRRGIFLEENAPDASGSHLVETMKIADSGTYGIFVEGDKSAIRDNRVLDTGGGPTSVAYGINLQFADDGQIAGNTISGVTETSENTGLQVGFSDRVRITKNEVTGVDGGSTADQAIFLSSVNNTIIAGNRLLNNPGTGTGGIVNSGSFTFVFCLDNEIGGFGPLPESGCHLNYDNHLLFF